ncbi:MAG: hypothetical protein AVDCRST_MAG73-2303 [uncultured Thermomicrobiales bacterium]|uniref:DUF1616 domain-containing protein n=1 Tax=uncultured Thermomicrobiales bacterium TaxID=1645740 RepID=A0A6J4UAF5_9BACT|nr:MAG: hypothetical protein AVDCRST_MAG73-2303 [uncultured Thermomicrobiales bacterium]
MLNASGEARWYERDLVVGQPVEVRLTVTNRERKTVGYLLTISGGGAAVDPLPVFTVENGETWTGQIRYVATTEGERLPIRFELWRQDRPDDTTPYRVVELRVNAERPTPASAEAPRRTIPPVG